MSSLADLPELVGFFSYSREDDEDSHGALSALRSSIQGELRGQLGRHVKTFRLWQDKEAIPRGTLWETEIKNAVAQSAFFIPIITPTVVASPYCKFELDAFLAREKELGRDDLVFPILYIDVPDLEDSLRRRDDPVLSLVAQRQYADWRKLRHRDLRGTDVSEAIEQFCRDIRDALRRRYVSPAERRQQEDEGAQRQAEAERQRQEAEAKRRDEVQRRRAAELETDARADAERRQREAEAQRLREQAEAKRRTEGEERRLRRSQAPPLWPPSRPVLAGGALVAVLLVGAVAAWLALSPTPAPVTPAPVTPALPERSTAVIPLSQGLVAYYPLNGNANDESGNGHNGAIHGNLTFVPDIFGKMSAHFDGVSAYISVPTNPNVDLQPPFSVAVWFNFEQGVACGGGPRVLHKVFYALITEGRGANRLISFHIGEGQTDVPVTAGPVASGTWTHVVATYDGANLELYLNGAFVARRDVTMPVPRSSYDLAIGENIGNGCDRYHGFLEDVRIYNRVLSSRDVAQLAKRTAN